MELLFIIAAHESKFSFSSFVYKLLDDARYGLEYHILADNASTVLPLCVDYLQKRHRLFKMREIPVIEAKPMNVHQHDKLIYVSGHTSADLIALVAKEALQIIMLNIRQVHIPGQNIQNWTPRTVMVSFVYEDIQLE